MEEVIAEAMGEATGRPQLRPLPRWVLRGR